MQEELKKSILVILSVISEKLSSIDDKLQRLVKCKCIDKKCEKTAKESPIGHFAFIIEKEDYLE